METRRRLADVTDLLGYLLIGVTSALCYLNNVTGDFVHDDVRAITTNPDVRTESPLVDIFRNDFWGKPMSDVSSHKSYRPLCVLSFRLNYVISSANPYGYHVTNNIFHCWASLLFTNVCRLVVFPADRDLAFFAGLLFAVHPIHTEAVSGIVGRADILCCIFYLLSFLTYHRVLRDDHCLQCSCLPLSWPIIFATLALLSKEQGITVLVVCLMVDIHTAKQYNRLTWKDLFWSCNFLSKQRMRRIWTMSFCFLVLLVFRMWMLGGSLPKFQIEDNPASFSSGSLTRLMTYTYLWSFNVWLVLCPINLSHDWQMGSIPLIERVSDSRNLASLIFITATVILTRKALCSKSPYQRQIFYGLVLSVFPFVPASNIFVTVGFVLAERILYIPSIGLIVLVTTGLGCLGRLLPRQWRHLKLFAVLCLLVVPACRTVVRNKVWLSRESLARSGIHVLPNNAKMHYNYANFLAERGNISQALHHYKEALSLWPSYVSAHNNLAFHTANKSEALEHLDHVLRLQPCHVNALTNMATIYHGSYKMTHHAISLLRYAMECDVSSPAPHLAIGAIYLDLGVTSLAGRHYRKSLEIAPTEARVHEHLGLYLQQKGEYQTAARHLERAVSLDPYRVSSLCALAKLYRLLGDNIKAERCFKRILSVNRSAQTLDMMGRFYFNTASVHKAVEVFQEAYNLDPTSTIVLHLSQALTGLGRYDQAEVLLRHHMADKKSDVTPIVIQLSNIYGLRKQHGKAIALLSEFKKSTQMELSAKELSLIHHEIGNHMKDLNMLDLAAKNYKEAVLLDSENVESHHNLAVYFHRQGVYEKAFYHYNLAISLGGQQDDLLLRNYHALLDIYRPEVTKSDNSPNSGQPSLYCNQAKVQGNLSGQYESGNQPLGQLLTCQQVIRNTRSLSP